MTEEALVGQLIAVDVDLQNLYLDPNNPRFTGSGWEYVLDDDICLPQVQEATRVRLVQEFAVDKLRCNMEVNGYLPIDRVVVRPIADDRYVVVEGNRRICSAKTIRNINSAGEEVSEDVLHSLKRIPCLVYTGEDRDVAWIMQGLRHITGIVDWSAYNKSKLLYKQHAEEGLGLTEIGRRFGLSAFGAAQWVRGYYAFQQASEKSDFVTEVDERIYPYLQELFGRSSIAVREWLEWDEKQHAFANELNFNEFLSWFYPKPQEITDDSEPDVFGEWEKRIIQRRDDIRQLAYLLVEARDHFEQFRRSKDLETAYGAAIAEKQQESTKAAEDVTQQVFNSISGCSHALDNIPLKMIRDEQFRTELRTSLGNLQKLCQQIFESL